MANLDFYALADDSRRIIDFLFAETDIVIYELGSEFDCELRIFRNSAELEDAFTFGYFQACYLQLWSPSVIAAPSIRRINLTGVPGKSFRYAVDGIGLMQLYLSGNKDGVIYHSHFGHFNEAGARQRDLQGTDACNWSALVKTSGRIQRFIRSQVSAKLYARGILSQAFSAVQKGSVLRFAAQDHRANSPQISVKNVPNYAIKGTSV
jgi:hypothetical protein